MCATQCPVAIDTGKLTKRMRATQQGARAQRVAQSVATRFGMVTTLARTGLWFANGMHAVLGSRVMAGLTGGMRRLSGNRMPLWNRHMPGPASRLPPPAQQLNGAPRVVYFPSCASRIMGPARGDPERDSLPTKTMALLGK